MRLNKKNIIVIICVIIFSIVIGVFVENKANNNRGASQYYIQECTKEFILKFYPLKYPNTMKLVTINYYNKTYKDEGYQIWCTEGYFTAENDIGLQVKKIYKIYMQFKFDTDKCYALYVLIDKNNYYGSLENVNKLYKKD